MPKTPVKINKNTVLLYKYGKNIYMSHDLYLFLYIKHILLIFCNSADQNKISNAYDSIASFDYGRTPEGGAFWHNIEKEYEIWKN
jgi:hypothetical protein